ncbi:MAG: hypothetical protein IJJ64_12220 [Butyrivibrio sp.]|nr:hypothetical protein [Butyrivibrio sp.]
MKKLLSAVLLCGALALTGCGGEATSSESDEAVLFESISGEENPSSEAPVEQGALDESKAEQENSSEESALEETSGDVTVEEETSDGVFGAYLMKADKDKIGTTNEYGLLYTVIYAGEFQDGSFSVDGALSYKNDPAQDTISVSDDVKHVFKTDENTVYQMIGGEDGPEDVTREEFIEHFNNCLEVGLYFEATVSDGVCTLVTIAA